MLLLLKPLLNTFVSTGVKSETLTQPDSVTVQPGHTLSISCTVSYSLGHYTAWIRQPAGKGLEWIGHKDTSSSYYKESLKSKFSIDLDTSSKTVTLTGNNMQPGDSAVYYCARLAQSLREYEELNKNN
uniref:Ig-like domain-containing protein n=1 Tax=Neogobius melanostomus TaxID=47308 RepID=A0A8C6UWU4_9GOBI